jgi:hypothetical protein
LVVFMSQGQCKLIHCLGQSLTVDLERAD